MQIGEAVVKFTSDAQASLDALKKVAEQADDSNKKSSAFADKFKTQLAASTSAAQTFSKAVLTIGTAVGAAAVGFGIKSVQAYQESENALAQLQAVIKSTGNAAGLTVDDYAEQATALEHLTGVSDEAVISSQSMLATFTNIRGGTMQKATETVLDMATAMNGGAIPAADQLRQQAIQLGKALNDPAEGFNMLRRVGVTFSDDQKKQIEGFMKLNQVGKAQQVMLDELQKEFGGSAKAAGQTLTGQINIAKETFGDFMEVVGGSIVQIAGPLVGAFNNWMKSMGGPEGMMEALTNKIKEVNQWMSENREIVVAVAGAIAGPLVVALALVIKQWVIFIATVSPFMILGAAIALLAYEIYTNWDKIVGTFNRVKQSIVDAFNNSKKAVDDFYNNSLKAATDAIFAFNQALINMKDAVIDFVLNSLRAFGEWLENNRVAIESVAAVLGTIFGPTLLVIAANAIAAGAAIAYNFTVAMVQAGIQAVIVGAQIAASFITNLVTTAAQAVVTGAAVTVSFIGSMISAGAQAVVTGYQITVSFIASLISLVTQVAITSTALIVQGVTSMVAFAASGWSVAAAVIAATWPILAIIAAIAALAAAAYLVIKNWEPIKSFFKDTFDSVLAWARNTGDAMAAPFVKAFNWIKDQLNSLKDTISKVPGVGALLNKVPGFASGVRNFAGGLAVVGENGPELVNLPKGSDVYNANQSQDLFSQGGKSVQITQNNTFVRDTDPLAAARELGFQLATR